MAAFASEQALEHPRAERAASGGLSDIVEALERSAEAGRCGAAELHTVRAATRGRGRQTFAVPSAAGRSLRDGKDVRVGV
jgi:hypothetical protein